MINIFLAVIVGILFGIITGLIPGIHINLISIFVLSLSIQLLQIVSPVTLAVFIVAMAITHTFLDTIPSVFLGAPDESTILSVLPGHKYLLDGRGFEAIVLTLVGSILALFLAIIFSPIIFIVIKNIYPFLNKYMAIILVVASIFLILKERKSKIWAAIIFFLSGILGIVVLNLPNLENPLFPLLSGLFGTSALIVSLENKVKIPNQLITFPVLNIRDLIKTISSGFLAGSMCSFLPGLGPAQAAIIGSSFYKKIKQNYFLILIGSLNTMNMVISFLAVYAIGKARNGAVITIFKILGEVTLSHVLLFFFVSLIVGIVAIFLTLFITKLFSKLFSKINYEKLVISVILLISIMVFILSGQFIGLFVLLISTFMGILPIKLGIGRNHLMGCLLLTTIFYFLL
jgi:putative membrane protein